MEPVTMDKSEINDILSSIWNCAIMCQDHNVSNRNIQYISLDVLKSIIEDFAHIRLDDE